MKVSRFIGALPGRAAAALIQVYRFGISPLLPPRCRFAPTCSEYALHAVREHGAARGLRLALRRILKCHPWGGSGYDPVPPSDTRNCARRRANGHGRGTAGLEI